MRVLITGGGTGGHLYPALAVAGMLREHDPDAEILFVGTSKGLESLVVPLQGYPFREISAVKWPRKLSLQALGVLPSLQRGYAQGVQIIKEFGPQAVFATGGYVSVPLVLAAARRGVPIFLHEQNSVPGMANKLLARWARAVFTTFPVPKGAFPGRTKLIYSGLPIRKEILEVDRNTGLQFFDFDDRLPVLLVTGGSGGSKAINEVMLEIYAMITKGENSLPKLQVIHLTGKREYEGFCQLLAEKGINKNNIGKLVIKPYLEKMACGMAVADLIISRAGAATLAEITARGIASILIPYPFAAGNHQYSNARYLVREQAAMLIQEQELTPALLLGKIEKLLFDDTLRMSMTDRSRCLGRPQAAEIIVRELLKTRV